jgi:hypothetical protein
MVYVLMFSHLVCFLGGFAMSNIKHSEKFVRIDNMIWKKTKVDAKGRVCLPQKLRSRLHLNGNSEILWISVHQRSGKSNEFIINVGVKE